MARIAFYPAPGVNVSDAEALVTDVIDPKTFYSVAPPKKTGTMPTVALAPDSSAYPAGYHAGDVGGLPAVDVDLVAGNIKDGVTIFDVLGTFENTLAEDILGDAPSGLLCNATAGGRLIQLVAAEGDWELATKTQDYDASSLAVGVAFGAIQMDNAADCAKLQLIMDGVTVAESAYLLNAGSTEILMATKVLSGSKVCSANIHNYDGNARNVRCTGAVNGVEIGAGVCIGSVKLV